MFSVLRDGFAFDLLILLLVGTIAGAALAAGVALAVDSYFGETLTDLLGRYGEYDVILHVKQEVGRAATDGLRDVLRASLPGARWKDGVAVAGKQNYFIALPPALRDRATLERLGSIFERVPGQQGYTLIIEPSLRLGGVPSGYEEALQPVLSELPGLSFYFRTGSDLVLVFDDVAALKPAERQLQKLLAQYKVLDLRFPVGFEPQPEERRLFSGRLADRFGDAVHAQLDLFTADGEGVQVLVRSLMELRDFLLSYASQVQPLVETEGAVGANDFLSQLSAGDRLVLVPKGSTDGDQHSVGYGEPGQATGQPNSIAAEVFRMTDGSLRVIPTESGPSEDSDAGLTNSLRYQVYQAGQQSREPLGEAVVRNPRLEFARLLDESLGLLNRLSSVTTGAQEAVEQAGAILLDARQALEEMAELRRQLGRLRDSGGSTSLLGVLLDRLMQDELRREGPSLQTLQDLDVDKISRQLQDLAARLQDVESADIDQIVSRVEMIKQTLPVLSNSEIVRSVRLLDRYIDGQVAPAGGIQVLVGRSVSPEAVQDLARECFDNPYIAVYEMPAGVVKPNARAELYRVLGQVRGIIAALVCMALVVLMLILDYATVFSGFRRLLVEKKARLAFLSPCWQVNLLAAAVGGLLLAGTYVFSGAELPFINGWHVGVIGMFMGLLASCLSERVSPVESAEVQAGEAMGLPYCEIMRQIVIPAARPGLLQLLNHSRRRV